MNEDIYIFPPSQDRNREVVQDSEINEGVSMWGGVKTDEHVLIRCNLTKGIREKTNIFSKALVNYYDFNLWTMDFYICCQ